MATYTGAASTIYDQTFVDRLKVGLCEVAEQVLAEPLATEFHSDRVVLAKKVVEGNTAAIDAAAKTLVGCNAAAINVDAPDKGLSDSAIAAAIGAQWNTLAGISTGS